MMTTKKHKVVAGLFGLVLAVAGVFSGVCGVTAQAQTVAVVSMGVAGPAIGGAAYSVPEAGGGYVLQARTPEVVAIVSQGDLMISSEPIFIRDDAYLDFEAEGTVLNAKFLNEKGLRAGVWRALFPRQV